ncbi:MAG: hypothetical protein AAAB19_21100, partial [Rhizobium sp.]
SCLYYGIVRHYYNLILADQALPQFSPRLLLPAPQGARIVKYIPLSRDLPACQRVLNRTIRNGC